MTSYSAGQSTRGISADDTLGIYSSLLPYDMGGFRINTQYPISVAPTASGAFSLALGPYHSAIPAYQPVALGVRSIVIGGAGTRADDDYAVSIGESTNFQGYLMGNPSGASSVAVGTIDAQGDDSVAVGIGKLGVDGYPGAKAAGTIVVGVGGSCAVAGAISMGYNNNGLGITNLGLWVAPTDSVVLGQPTLSPAAVPVNSATLIGSGTLRANQVLIGTSANTGARGLSTDDTKSCVWSQTDIYAEFNYWFARTSGRTDNKGLLNVSSTPYTLSAANMRSKVYRYSGAGAQALTTPTAAQILATLPTFQVDGDGFLWQCIAETQNVVLTAGAGVTITDDTSLTANQVNAATSSLWLVRRSGAATVVITRLHNGGY